MVLLVLADEADSCGLRCFPSLRRIAARAAVDLKTARASVARLEDAGLIAVQRPSRTGRGHVNRYVVLMGRDPAELLPTLDHRWMRIDNRLPLGDVDNLAAAEPNAGTRRSKRGNLAGTDPTYSGRPYVQSPLVAVVEPTVAAAAERRSRDMARMRPSCGVCDDGGRVVDASNTVAPCPACTDAHAV